MKGVSNQLETERGGGSIGTVPFTHPEAPPLTDISETHSEVPTQGGIPSPPPGHRQIGLDPALLRQAEEAKREFIQDKENYFETTRDTFDKNKIRVYHPPVEALNHADRLARRLPVHTGFQKSEFTRNVKVAKGKPIPIGPNAPRDAIDNVMHRARTAGQFIHRG